MANPGRLILFGTAFLSVQLAQLNTQPSCSHASREAVVVTGQMAGMDMSEQSGKECDHVPVGRSCDQMGACVLVFTGSPATSESASVPRAVAAADKMPMLASVLFAPELPPPRA